MTDQSPRRAASSSSADSPWVCCGAAVITPPDVISQIGLAIPLILLYELSILSTRMVEKRRAEVYGEDAAKSDEEIAAEVDAWEDPDEVGPAYDDDDDGMGVDDTDFNEGR